MRSLRGNLRLGTWCIEWAIARSIHQEGGLRFPCNDWTDEVSNLFIIWLFFMNLGLRSIKTNNWSADNFKKHVTSMSCTLEPALQSGATGQQIPFWQLSIDRNIDCICLGHLASNARSLHENSQSERAYYWSHIINTDIELDSLSGQSSLIMNTTFTVKRHESCSIGINRFNHLRSQQNVYFSRFCSHIEVTTR